MASLNDEYAGCIIIISYMGVTFILKVERFNGNVIIVFRSVGCGCFNFFT